ncbi:hypothetical protein AOLI_G00293000 [Acnodon oligacanthus]
MFITVLYGDKQKSLFNIQCKTVALLACMKVKCSCEHEAEIDLANLNGQVMNLQCHSGGPASDVLSQREVYILISVRRSSDPSDPVHTSLLHNCDLNDPLVLAKLQSEETERKQCASGELNRSSRTLTSSVSNQSKPRISRRIRFSSASTHQTSSD